MEKRFENLEVKENALMEKVQKRLGGLEITEKAMSGEMQEMQKRIEDLKADIKFLSARLAKMEEASLEGWVNLMV